MLPGLKFWRAVSCTLLERSPCCSSCGREHDNTFEGRIRNNASDNNRAWGVRRASKNFNRSAGLLWATTLIYAVSKCWTKPQTLLSSALCLIQRSCPCVVLLSMLIFRETESRVSENTPTTRRRSGTLLHTAVEGLGPPKKDCAHRGFHLTTSSYNSVQVFEK